MRHGHGQIHHFAALQVGGEDVFGRTQHQLPHRYTVQILQLFDFWQQIRHLPQVTDVYTAIVHRLGQRNPVHGGGRVVQTVSNLNQARLLIWLMVCRVKSKRTKVGIWTVNRNSAASLTSWRCLGRGASRFSECLMPGEYTSGLKRISNSVSFNEPTAIAAVFTIFLVLSSTVEKKHWIQD